MEDWENIKFKTVFLKKAIPSDVRIEDLKYWISRFEFYDLCEPRAGRSYGNMSFRVKPGENEFIITAAHQVFGEDMPDDRFVKVIRCDIEKNIVEVEGLMPPSSETLIHYVVYKTRPDVNAVLHGHCRKLVCSVDLGFPSTTNEKDRMPELLAEIEKMLSDENFIIIKNHGFLALGKDIDDSGRITLRAYQRCFQ